MSKREHPSYLEIFRILSEYGVQSVEDFERIYKPYDSRWRDEQWISHGDLDEVIVDHLAITLKDEEQRIHGTQGSKFILRTTPNSLETVLLNKIALYSTLSTTFSPPAFFKGGDVLGEGYVSVPNEFYLALLRAKPLVAEGIFSVIPSGLEHQLYTGSPVPDWPELHIDLPGISLSHDDLRRQLIEEESTNVPCGSTVIYLPHLKGVSLETMLKIRRDEGDSFIRFQRKIESLFKVAEELQSEDKLLEVMHEVDYEIRVMNDKYKQLQRKKFLRGGQVALGVFCLVLIQLAPKEIATELGNVLGSLTVFDGIRQVSDIMGNAGSLKQSDFYIPWKLAQSKRSKS